MTITGREVRFAVVVRYEGENPANRYPKDVYWHRTAKAAARRLAALINCKAAWVPLRTRVGTRFYIVDHGKPNGPMYSLTQFREVFGHHIYGV